MARGKGSHQKAKARRHKIPHKVIAKAPKKTSKKTKEANPLHKLKQPLRNLKEKFYRAVKKK